MVVSLAIPMMSVEWFNICYFQEVRHGQLIDPEIIDHSDWITKILHDAKFCYDVVGDIVQIQGYVPKSFNELDANPEL